MNQAHTGRYYEEDFEPKRAIPWMAVVFAILIVAAMCLASAIYGYNDGYIRGRAFQASLAKPAAPTPVVTPQLSRSECVNACFSKDRMSRVK